MEELALLAEELEKTLTLKMDELNKLGIADKSHIKGCINIRKQEIEGFRFGYSQLEINIANREEVYTNFKAKADSIKRKINNIAKQG